MSSKKLNCKLRSSGNHLQVLGTSPEDGHMEITGIKLPTYEQVLLCYMATMGKKRAEDATKNAKLVPIVCNLVFEKVRIHYEKANIPIKPINKCGQDIMKLNEEFRQVNKNKYPKRIEEFRTKIKGTMPFWPRGTLEAMKEKILNRLTNDFDKKRLVEDSKFLESMIKDREATYMKNDLVHQAKEKKKQQKRKVALACDQIDPISSKRVDAVEENLSDNELFVPPSPKKTHKRSVKVGTTITLPHDVLKSKKLVSASIRNDVSPTALVAIVEALIETTGGNKEAVVLSASRVHQYRLDTTKTIAEEIKDNWKPPSKGVVHWDGKLMQTLDGFGKEERLPVLLSGEYNLCSWIWNHITGYRYTKAIKVDKLVTGDFIFLI